MSEFKRFDRPDLTPRAREILACVERAAEARRRELLSPQLRVDEALLTVVELGVAGLEREAVAERLRAHHGGADADRLLDAVFGPGSSPTDRLRRGIRSTG